MKQETKIKLAEGKVLPVVEEFYSIQGEGFHTGKAAYFLRVGGCDVGCKWCDEKRSWNPEFFPPLDTDEVVERISQCPAKSVVITGGEPLLYNLDYLCGELKKRNIETYLETSGAHSFSGQWNWICLSPKQSLTPREELYPHADELKVIIANHKDFDWAVEQAGKVPANCLLYLQPEWSVHKEMMPAITDFILKNPHWKISLQSHKYMKIP